MDLTGRHIALLAAPTAVGFAGVMVANPFTAGTAPSAVASTVSKSAGVTTATGTAEYTPWGTLQVRVAIANGRITKISLPLVPHGPISAFSSPTLVQEAMTAQSADIHAVSGATYTSQTFVESLQAALSAAHFR